MSEQLDSPMVEAEVKPPPRVYINMFCDGGQVLAVEKFKVAMNELAGLTPTEFEGDHELEGVTIKIRFKENEMDKKILNR